MKKWKKNPNKKTVTDFPNNHRRLPVGQVKSQTTDDPIRGDHLAMPLFGWVAVRDKTEDPLVMVTTLLLDKKYGPVGAFQIELPIFEETVDPTVVYLESMGWDGRIWPIDAGWPTDHPDEHAHLTALMEQAGLKATMTFPPGPQGAICINVSIQRAQGPFLMPPLSADIAGRVLDPKKKERLLKICADPRQFYAPLADEEERPVRILH